MERRYQALIFDLDGTAIPNGRYALPSERVINAVRAATKLIHVSAATGRPISNSREILQKLGLESPCIVSGGAQIINPATEETLWERKLDSSQVKKIIDICTPYPYTFLFDDELLDEDASTPAKEKIADGQKRVAYIMAAKEVDADLLVKGINEIADVVAHTVPSWTPGHRDIHITHKLATKQHALEILLDMISVQKDATMAVGDSNNDLPLFRIAGFKVAMGNASDELKGEADFITSSVDEDGLAQVIEQRILP